MIEKEKSAGKDNRRKIRRLNKRRKRSELQGIMKINKIIKQESLETLMLPL